MHKIGLVFFSDADDFSCFSEEREEPAVLLGGPPVQGYEGMTRVTITTSESAFCFSHFRRLPAHQVFSIV